MGHLCTLYRAISRGTFCAHAAARLLVDTATASAAAAEGDEEAGATMPRGDDDDERAVARGLLPRLVRLLRLRSRDPARAARAALGKGARRAEDGVGSTIAALLELLRDDRWRLAAVRDLLHLASDLRAIDDSGALAASAPRGGEGGLLSVGLLGIGVMLGSGSGRGVDDESPRWRAGWWQTAQRR